MGFTKASADLTIVSPNLTPEELSAFIGMQPDTWQTKGKNIISHATKKTVSSISKHNIWTLLSQSEAIEDATYHLNRILERVDPYAEKIAVLSKDNKITVENYAYTDDGEPFFAYDHETLQKISRLGVVFHVGSRLDFVRGDLVEQKFHEHGFFTKNGKSKIFHLRYDKAAAYIDACNDEDLAIHEIWFYLADENNPTSSRLVKLPFTLDFDDFSDHSREWKQVRLRSRRIAKAYLKKAPQYTAKYLKENPASPTQLYVDIFPCDWYWWQSNLELQVRLAKATK